MQRAQLSEDFVESCRRRVAHRFACRKSSATRRVSWRSSLIRGKCPASIRRRGRKGSDLESHSSSRPTSHHGASSCRGDSGRSAAWASDSSHIHLIFGRHALAVTEQQPLRRIALIADTLGRVLVRGFSGARCPMAHAPEKVTTRRMKITAESILEVLRDPAVAPSHDLFSKRVPWVVRIAALDLVTVKEQESAFTHVIHGVPLALPRHTV